MFRLLPVAFAILTALAACGFADPPAPADPPPGDRETLRRYARDTWRALAAMALPGGLPADGLRRLADGTWAPTGRTSPTDIGAYLWSTLAAEELQFIGRAEARRRLERTLDAVARLERVHGFFYDRMDPRTGDAMKPAPGGKAGRPLLSSVDNGWLAAALMMVRNTRPALREKADALLEPMDFRFFYKSYDPADPAAHPGLMYGVYWPNEGSFGYLHAIVNSETRIASYVGIARGQLPPEHYYRIDRTWPPGRRPQRQVPEGVTRTYRSVPVFEGHYTYRGKRIVPSWGGSMFEALMVPLFVPEARWGPASWGVNHPLYVRAQIEHGLEEARYGAWGFSPACRPEGGYRTYGVDALGTSPKGYTSNDADAPAGAGKSPGAFAGGVVTPHASFLALRFAPREAMANLRALQERFPIYGPYGFRDSVNVASGVVSDTVLALDQGMILAAIANALADDVMQHAFSDGAVEAALRPLIAPEEFTAGPAPAADPAPGPRRPPH